MTKFDIIRDIINSKKKNDILTRQEMLLATETRSNISGTYGTTVDNIRRVLTLNQVLSEPIKPGYYHVLAHIRYRVKYNDLREIAYRQSWKAWFMKPEFFIDIE